MVDCPICGKPVRSANINFHIDSGCETHVEEPAPENQSSQYGKPPQVSSFFRTPAKRQIVPTTPIDRAGGPSLEETKATTHTPKIAGKKRPSPAQSQEDDTTPIALSSSEATVEPSPKKTKITALQRVAPLAERMRPCTLDGIYGQDLVGPDGVLRGLIESDRVPSMILWGGAGTGKTTIARVVANVVGSRFVEINSTSSGIAECKKLFAEARTELGLTGRKTILFCDEIHRFSKSQQDVFLGPVESGQVTLIGATTENPSFKVQTALLSRCRTFTLQKLSDHDIGRILRRALEVEGPNYAPSGLVDDELIDYLASFSDGDARTALNLLELAMNLSSRSNATKNSIKAALTKTLVYDRAGDQHCK